MMVSENTIEEIQFFAGLLYTDEELSRLLCVDLQEFRIELTAGATARAQAVHRGRFLRESRLRLAELTMAEAGSSPALAAARAMRDRMRNS